MEKKETTKNLFPVSLARLWSIKAFNTEVVIQAVTSGNRFVLRIRNNWVILPDLDRSRLVPTYHSKTSNYRLSFPSQSQNKFAHADRKILLYNFDRCNWETPKIKLNISSSMSVNECINQVVSYLLSLP